MVVDDDGTGLFSTGLRHGDALHVGDLVPSGLASKCSAIHESEGQTVTLQTPGMALYGPAPPPAASTQSRWRAATPPGTRSANR